MSLATRLHALQRQRGAGAQRPSDEDSLRSRIDRLRVDGPRHAAGASAEQLAARLQGELDPAGYLVIRATIPSVPMGAKTGVGILGASVARERLLFLDTETNGLAGGTGTLAFLVGLVRAGGDRLQLEQYLLTRYAAEPGMLASLGARVAADALLVTYNGKRFDLPLLETRCRLHRLAHGFCQRRQADLLYPVRRLYGAHWSDCRQLTAEVELLGQARVADLPGAEAPAAWQAWLRHGMADGLVRVVEHNRRDLLGLVGIWQALECAIAEPGRPRAGIRAGARQCLERGDHRAAVALLQGNLARLTADGLRLLARLYRRAGDWDAALPLWRTLAGGGCVEALEQLAKFHEHRRRDPVAALDFAERLPDSAAKRRRIGRLRKRSMREATRA